MFLFQTLQVTSWNLRKCLDLALESTISQNIRNILRVDFFNISIPENHFLKYNNVPFPKIKRTFFRVFVSQNIRKAYFWENIRNFLIIWFFIFSQKKTFLVFREFREMESPRNSRRFHLLMFFFRKYKKATFPEAFFWENVRNFFRVGVFKKKYKKFFRETFWRQGQKSVIGSLLIYYVNLIRKKMVHILLRLLTQIRWSISWTWIQRRKSFCLRVLLWRN